MEQLKQQRTTTTRFIFQFFGLLLGFCLTSCNPQNAHLLENKWVSVRISEQGAELQSIFNKTTKQEILWVGDSTFWERQSPIMFPVNVRFYDDKYTYMIFGS